jgi:small subunit ribosomal protein S4
VISIAPASLKSPIFGSNLEVAQSRRPPEWLEWNDQEKTGKVLQPPPREQIDTPVDEQLIVEYYSR